MCDTNLTLFMGQRDSWGKELQQAGRPFSFKGLTQDIF